MRLTPTTHALIQLALDSGASSEEARTAALLALRRLVDEGLLREDAAPASLVERPWRGGRHWPKAWCAALDGPSLNSPLRLCRLPPSKGAPYCEAHRLEPPPLSVHTLDFCGVDCIVCSHVWIARDQPFKLAQIVKMLTSHHNCRLVMRLWAWSSRSTLSPHAYKTHSVLR